MTQTTLTRDLDDPDDAAGRTTPTSGVTWFLLGTERFRPTASTSGNRIPLALASWLTGMSYLVGEVPQRVAAVNGHLLRPWWCCP